MGFGAAQGGAAGLPGTTKGDLLVHNGTEIVRIGVGANDQVVTADSAQTEGLKWATPSSGGTIVDTLTGNQPFAFGGIVPQNSASAIRGFGVLGDTLTAIDFNSRIVYTGGEVGFQQDTSTTSGNDAYLNQSTAAFFMDPTANTKLIVKFRMNQLTDTRFYVGLSNISTPASSVTPVADCAGLMFSSVVPDTNFQFYTNDGSGGGVMTDSEFAADTNTHILLIALNGATNVIFTLYDNTFTQEATKTVTSDLANGPMNFVINTETQTTATKQHELHYAFAMNTV